MKRECEGKLETKTKENNAWFQKLTLEKNDKLESLARDNQAK